MGVPRIHKHMCNLNIVLTQTCFTLRTLLQNDQNSDKKLFTLVKFSLVDHLVTSEKK